MGSAPPHHLQKVVNHIDPQAAENHQRPHRKLHQARLPGQTILKRTQTRVAESGDGVKQRIPERLPPGVFLQKPRQHQQESARLADQRVSNDGPGQPFGSPQRKVVAQTGDHQRVAEGESAAEHQQDRRAQRHDADSADLHHQQDHRLAEQREVLNRQHAQPVDADRRGRHEQRVAPGELPRTVAPRQFEDQHPRQNERQKGQNKQRLPLFHHADQHAATSAAANGITTPRSPR